MQSKIPTILYGTAWKEDQTEELVRKAIAVGFRAIDTANQRRHYYEAAVGNAIAPMLKNGMKREELFIQTKFTFANGHDHRIPYDSNAKYTKQVQQSFQSSLEHLQTSYLDSYILHGPLQYGINDADLEVWGAMEVLQKEGKTKYIGLSNVDLHQLKEFYSAAKIKPKFVQNRCFAQQQWDKQVRMFCAEHDILYQGFSLLTANTFFFPQFKYIAQKHNKTAAQVVFKFAMQAGMIPITGTTKEGHMKEDLTLDFELNKEELQLIENIAVH